jgi:hypothetical protein
MSLDLTKQRLESATDRVERYIDDNIIVWATETILLPAQSNLETSINERAARALSLEKSGFMKIDLVWDLRGDDGEPLHFFLEFGTSPHKIEAKGKEHGGANALHWTGPSGKNVFAKIVNHPGSKKHVGLIQRIKDERMPSLQAKIVSETQNKMETDSL